MKGQNRVILAEDHRSPFLTIKYCFYWILFQGGILVIHIAIRIFPSVWFNLTDKATVPSSSLELFQLTLLKV